ncbi:LOG family protein [Candidatus Uhrbacteria bacterium]|nr:LOG family protein [Candidatus Uhrbacteria bacterium]
MKKNIQKKSLNNQNQIVQSYLKYKICVSGSADTTYCSDDALEKSKAIGHYIVEKNGVVVTGATTGIPYWAAIGAKEAGGISIGISPAASEIAHVKSYRLPVDYFDLIMYTGFEYSGRNLLLVRSSDAIIEICGRIGTLNEFTIAFEDQKPIGVLEGCGGTSVMIREIIEKGHRGSGKIIYDTDPKALVERLIEVVDKEKVIPMPKYDYVAPRSGKRSRG